MTLAHTPGPWHSRPAIKPGEYTVTAESGGFAPLARVKGDKRSTLTAAHANARLMAAAPDLLEALLTMIEACPDREKNDAIAQAVDMALGAIGKAITVTVKD
jgi:hypothetical protein